MKHAYLIMAHADLKMLQAIIFSIDDSRNDIFVHIDAKATFDGKALTAQFSRLYVIPDRIDAAWADYSLVEIEIALFKFAHKFGPYSYYHLLSGSDIPVKSQDYIHEFCERNQGKEFIAFSSIDPKDLKWRSAHRFILTRHFREEKDVYRILRGLHIRIQDIFFPKKIEMIIKKGSQWCSVTNEFVAYLLEKEPLIKCTFERTFAPDEMFIQTLAWNSYFKDRIFDPEESACGNMRFIRWKDREPLPLRVEWIDEMIKSKHWFARKCNDISIVNNISNKIYS